MKNRVTPYCIKFSFGSFRLWIRTNYSDPDPDPPRRFGSFRIRIHNSDLKCLLPRAPGDVPALRGDQATTDHEAPGAGHASPRGDATYLPGPRAGNRYPARICRRRRVVSGSIDSDSMWVWFIFHVHIISVANSNP